MKQEESLKQLNEALMNKTFLCSSQGTVSTFPAALKLPYQVNGIGLIVCQNGSFSFTLNGKPYTACKGQTVFIPEYSSIQVESESADLEIFLLVYQVEPIREIMGNLVLSMYPYYRGEPCYVWQTGEEDEVVSYMRLIDDTQRNKYDLFSQHEQKLLLLALTHRLCSIYSRKLFAGPDGLKHKHETFLKLVRLIEKYYTEQRGVEFYADKLCLSPKYLSALAKSVSGYTVQEIVFKAIVRRSISLLTNTQKSIQEIADELNFPNASYFGTFFKKQTGKSPLQYRTGKEK